MSELQPRVLDDCGCCQPAAAATPRTVWNRPSLRAIDYRVGTFGGFLRAMLDDVAARGELRDWTTRDRDDFGIAVLHMWAYVADILTFYQERIASEAYLNTAVHRESILRLAALLDYRLHPGAAAVAHLAYTADTDSGLTIPQRLRVQSVPGQGETPQVFETVESIAAAAERNCVPILPEPVSYYPLDANRAHGTPTPLPAAQAPDATQLLFVEMVSDHIGRPLGRPVVEEKEVVGVERVYGQDVVHWQPPVMFSRHPQGRVWPFRRKHRLFGAAAPEKYLKPKSSAGLVKWSEEATRYESYHQDGTSTVDRRDVDVLELEGTVEDLAPGAALLVAVEPDMLTYVETPTTVSMSVAPDGAVVLARVKRVDQVQAVWGPLSGPATRVTLQNPLLPGFDFYITNVTVYELSGPEIKFWSSEYPATIARGSTSLYVRLDALVALETGRRLILDDAQQEGELVTVESAAEVDADGDGGNDHWRIAFTPPLSRDLETETAKLFGNVARATHGETVREEIVGSGDASVAFQSFPLRKSPVTYVPDPVGPGGVGSTLELRVDGVLWHERPTLYGQGDASQVYTTRIDNEGVTTVQFGDGVTGARLPSGRNNVVARYRHGLGLVGRVRRRTLTLPLDRPVGLNAVTNPAAAEGGADPERLEDARRNAPNTVRTFDRIVSLRDFEDAAREYAGVAKARAVWTWESAQRVVVLTVAGDAGQPLGPTAMGDLVAYLDARRDRYRVMRVENYTPVAVLLSARLAPHPDHVQQQVQAAAERAALDFFAFENRQLGQPVNLSDVYEVLQNVAGVVAVDVDRLAFKPPPGPPLAVDAFFSELAFRGLRMAGPRPQPLQARLPLFPHELAHIEDPAVDLQITTDMQIPGTNP